MEQTHDEHEQQDMEMRNIIEEARVVLPGVQALFGFQTIAVSTIALKTWLTTQSCATPWE